MRRIIFFFAAMVLTAAFLGSCSEDEPTDPDPTLYDRVGGTAMVSDPANSGQMIEKGRLTLRTVVDSAVIVIAADPQMTPYFTTLLAEVGSGNMSGMAALKENFTDFLCLVTGSKNPAYTYSGKNMQDAHDPAKNSRMGKKANSADFDKFVDDIGIALVQNGVSPASNKALYDDMIALLNSTKPVIVQE